MRKQILTPLISFLILLLLQSCSTNYVSQLASTSALRQNQKGTFIFENDTLKVFYRFFGLNGPIQTRITNKLKSPILVDLQQSSFVFNGKAYSYLGQEITNNNYLAAQEIRIPAGQYFDNQPIHIADFVPLSYQEDQLKDEVITGLNGKSIKAKTIQFTVENTPLLLQNYISYKLDQVQAPYVDQMQSFYIQKIARIKNIKLEDLQVVQEQQSNFFMIRTKNNQKFLGSVGIGILSSGLSIGFGVGGIIF